MEKRAAKYSSRNPMPFVQDLMSGGKRIVLMGYTDQWRDVRKVMHSILNSRQMTQFAEYQDLETKQLLWDCLARPDLWYRANQRYANAVILSVVFGRRLLLDDENLEPLLKQAEEMVKHLQPGSTLVDTFPVLSKLPMWMQWWRAKGLRLYEESKRYVLLISPLSITTPSCAIANATRLQKPVLLSAVGELGRGRAC